MTARPSRRRWARRSSLASKLTLRQLDREVTAHASHFDRRDAIQAVANLLPNGAPGHEVESAADAFLASESVVTVAETAKGTPLHDQAHLGA